MPSGKRKTLQNSAFLGLILAGCAASGTAVRGWGATLALSQCEEAAAFLASRDREAARLSAMEALASARQCGDPIVEAQALRLYGLAVQDPSFVMQALQLSRAMNDGVGLARGHTALAEILLEQGAPSTALEQADLALQQALGWHDRSERAELEARARHLSAMALRRLGRTTEAHTAERQAALSISLLDDRQLLPLRVSIEQAVADDEAGLGHAQRALDGHARAAALAHELGDERAEAQAMAGMARDLSALGHPSDAAQTARRALDLALRVPDADLAASIAAHGLEILDALAEDPSTERWQAFAAALGVG